METWSGFGHHLSLLWLSRCLFYCCTDGPAAGVPGNVTGPVAVCQRRACESLRHNYLAMQHIIQSSSIQTSAQSTHPS